MTDKSLMHRYLDIINEEVDVPDESYENLDALVEEAKDRELPGAGYAQRFEILDRIFADHGFDYHLAGFWDEGTIPATGLAEKRLDCTGLSYAGQAMAQAIGIPAQVAYAPKKMYVTVEDDGEYLNWDPGAYLIDEDGSGFLNQDAMQRLYGIPDEVVEKGMYLTGIDDDLALADAYRDRARLRMEEDDPDIDAAWDDIQEAVDINELNGFTWMTAAAIGYKTEDYHAARMSVAKLLALNPQSPLVIFGSEIQRADGSPYEAWETAEKYRNFWLDEERRGRASEVQAKIAEDLGFFDLADQLNPDS